MTLLPQAAQQAVEAAMEALEDSDIPAAFAILRTLRAALQQQPEPVAWHSLTAGEIDQAVGELVDLGTDFVAPLYAIIEGVERTLRDRNAGARADAPPALQEVPAAVRDTHGNIVLHNGREVCYRDEAPPPALQQEVPREPVAPSDDEIRAVWRQVRMEDASDLGMHLRFARALLALYPSTTQQQEAGSGWQPIESAPKGRTVLAGYFNRAGKWRTVRAHYYLPQTLELSDDYNGDDEGDGFAPEGWYEEVESSETINFTDEPPTHWMPLPAAPSTPEKAEGGKVVPWVRPQECAATGAGHHDGPYGPKGQRQCHYCGQPPSDGVPGTAKEQP